MSEIYEVKKNFILTLERVSRKGIFDGITVIRTSGYTTTVKALNQNYFLTQLETLPRSDRSHLPDPFIAPQGGKVLLPYEAKDCTVFNFYFTPACDGLDVAMQETTEFLEKEIFPKCVKHALIGHSKGGLFVGGITKYIDTSTNIIMMAPTISTPMGNEEMVFSKLDEYKASQTSKLKRVMLAPEIGFYKKFTHWVGSRRHVDYDMATDSDFLRDELDLSNLKNHNVMLITAQCPRGYCNIPEAVFRHYGEYLGLDKDGDGMVLLENQLIPEKFGVNKIVPLIATHPTILKKAGPYIADFLGKI